HVMGSYSKSRESFDSLQAFADETMGSRKQSRKRRRAKIGLGLSALAAVSLYSCQAATSESPSQAGTSVGVEDTGSQNQGSAGSGDTGVNPAPSKTESAPELDCDITQASANPPGSEGASVDLTITNDEGAEPATYVINTYENGNYEQVMEYKEASPDEGHHGPWFMMPTSAFDKEVVIYAALQGPNGETMTDLCGSFVYDSATQQIENQPKLNFPETMPQ
ncbi:MAG TPA: hypothetical protein VLA92_01040, partial [Candidatus Saccharimonadales bacterium]|nr:hypothetical protein [Candidatus Saccharimonadales bacterium]